MFEVNSKGMAGKVNLNVTITFNDTYGGGFVENIGSNQFTFDNALVEINTETDMVQIFNIDNGTRYYFALSQIEDIKQYLTVN